MTALGPPIRCAIYTRKSSEEGLDQDFNSLHAQRAACEAYVLSQADRGWSALADSFDDGGYSGATLDRPAIQGLLSQVRAGLVDVIVVYKIDRLTRSLADFARLVELLDKAGASFVSVTQAFNTATPMGRLTLNILLSFAQFEREITGERIRDKFAASRAQGLWMSGTPPLGYDPPAPGGERVLILNADQAAQVRQIYERYLCLGSIRALAAELAVSAATRPGPPLSRGVLYRLLKNRVYLGEIVHRGVVHAGRHAAIIAPELFDQVQARLADNRRGQTCSRKQPAGERAPALLAGRLIDADGELMSPSRATSRSGKAHRYYISASLLRGDRRPRPMRLPAKALEELVVDRISRLVCRAADADPAQLPALIRAELVGDGLRLLIKRTAIVAEGEDPRATLARLVHSLPPGDTFSLDPENPNQLRAIVGVRFQSLGGRTWVINAQGRAAVLRSRPDAALVKALHRAHAILREAGCHFASPPEDLARSARPTDAFHRKLMQLAFLAPDLQLAILNGRQPPGLTLQSLLALALPLAWPAQRRLLGFDAPGL